MKKEMKGIPKAPIDSKGNKITGGAIYNPSASYSWKPDEIFDLSGLELEYIFKTITEYLNSPESMKVLKAYEVHRILEQKLKEGVEKGVITPQK